MKRQLNYFEWDGEDEGGDVELHINCYNPKCGKQIIWLRWEYVETKEDYKEFKKKHERNIMYCNKRCENVARRIDAKK